MLSNRGMTSLRRKRRSSGGMQEFDRLPVELRAWLATALLPWGLHSVRRAYARALARTHSPELALSELDRIQTHLIARDAHRVWGADHPGAGQ